jgi:hypothetical protein
MAFKPNYGRDRADRARAARARNEKKSERETRKPRCAKPSAPKRSQRMKPILHWKKSKAEAQLVAGFQSSVLTEFNAQRIATIT